MPIKLTVSQPAPVSLSYVEAAIKPEVTGHVTPTYEEQTVYPAAGTTFGRVEVDAIPDPTAIKEIGSNGDHDVRRYGVARVDVQPTLQSKTATPTEQAQTVLPDTGYDGLESVEIGRIPTEYIIPTGTKNISQNGTESVREYDSVDVNVPIPPEYIIPTGTKTITENGTGINVREFERVDVDVSDKPDVGVWYSDYDEDGQPHSYTAKGLQNNNFRQLFNSTAYFNIHSRIENVNLINCKSATPHMTQNNLVQRLYIQSDASYAIGINQFSSNTALKYVIFNCNISTIGADAFNLDTSVELYDFSKNTTVPSLGNARAMTHADNCVIRVPQSLLAEWQEATNWNALTGVVWEGV